MRRAGALAAGFTVLRTPAAWGFAVGGYAPMFGETDKGSPWS